MIKKLFTLLCLCVLCIGSAWGEDVTIAYWGKVSLAANTDVNASSYQGTTAPKMTSSKAITSSGTGNCYYGGSAGGATITVSGLPSGYQTKQITFYSRASKSGNMAVSYSTDNGDTYTNAGSASLSTSENLKTVTLTTPVSNITNIKFVHSATTGSLYFGTVTITGVAISQQVVTIDTPTGGILTLKNVEIPVSSNDKFYEGTKLNVTLLPDETHTGGNLKVEKTIDQTDVTATVYDAENKILTVPAYDITVSATFDPTFVISAASITGGNVSWEDSNHNKVSRAAAGTIITALAEPDSRHENPIFDIFKTIDNTVKISHTNGVFEMPAYDVTISATFDEKSGTQLATPTNIQVTNKTYYGATLTWAAVEHADGYEVYLTKGEDDIENDLVIEGSSYTMKSILDAKTEYKYKIVAVSNDEANYFASEAAVGSFTTADYPAATLTLSENGHEVAFEGEHKLKDVVTLPSEVEYGIDQKTLVGWSSVEIATPQGEPTENYYALGADYTISSINDKLYAVFATVSYDSENLISIAGGDMSSGAPKTWTINGTGTYSGNGVKFDGENDYIKSPDLSSSKAKSVIVKIKAGHNGGAGSVLTVTALDAFENVLSSDSYVPANAYTSQSTTQTFNLSTSKTIKYIKVSMTSKTNNLGMKYCEVLVPSVLYSEYTTQGTEYVNVPVISLASGTYTEVQNVVITAEDGAEIRYTINGSAPTAESTLYSEPISLTKRGEYCIQAIAIKNEVISEVAEAYYTIDLPYSLEELVETDLTSGTNVSVVFENVYITNINGKNVSLNVQKDNHDILIYYTSSNAPSEWTVGGKVSGCLTNCIWKKYNDSWEFAPAANSWNWTNLDYTAPLTKDVTIAAGGYSSFSATCDMAVPEDVEAWYATACNSSSVSMTKIEDGKIPANTGVILKGTAGEKYTLTETVGATTIEGNLLVAIAENQAAQSFTAGDGWYYLSTEGCFKDLVNDSFVLKAGKAYLYYKASNAKELTLEFGEPTGINNVSNTNIEGAIYNLNGIRVNSMVKGNVYIVNGKKYLNK